MTRYLSVSSLALLGLFAAALFVSGCRGELSRKPPIHLNPNMDNQNRIDAQEPSDFFKDGRGSRLLLPGTVARGFLRLDTAFYEGHQNGQGLTTLPVVATDAPVTPIMRQLGIQPGKAIALTEAFVKRGKDRYDIFCTPCHGFGGDGKGIVTRYSDLLAILVRNLHREDIRKKPIGDLYKTIAQGFGTMKSFNSQLEVVDRWAIAAYIRALQLSRYTAAHNGGKK